MRESPLLLLALAVGCSSSKDGEPAAASGASASPEPAASISASPSPPAVAPSLVTMAPLGRPILEPRKEDWHFNDHAFVRGAGGAWTWFGIAGPNPPRPNPGPKGPRDGRFARATSSSLAGAWTEVEPAFVERLEQGGVMWAPHVVHDGARYHMFYCNGGDPARFGIARRTSPDSKVWSEPEVLFRDGFQARDPMVFFDQARARWLLYYTATEDPSRASPHIVAARESKDLQSWGERIVVYRDRHVGKAYGPTESPFVVARGGWFYLFIGPRPYDPPRPPEHPNWRHPGYVGTDVLRSRDPLLFTDDGLVGHLEVHAPEIIQDERGDWFVSSAGIRQGGLYLSRLTWSDAR